MKHKLIILSGPSGVGKSPLYKALKRFYPELIKTFVPLVLYNSRNPRPGEEEGVDYFFRTKEQIQSLKPENQFIKMEVRGDIQAIDIKRLQEILKTKDVFFEGNPFVGRVLLDQPDIGTIDKLSIFMSPLSEREISEFKEPDKHIDLQNLVTEIMRRKLLRRTRKQKDILSLKDLENIERRASSAYGELTFASLFQYVIPNHDGEDSENWDSYQYPIGEARKSLLSFVDLLKGKRGDFIEKWGSGML
ncbi:MAG: hypothetical protein JXJ22_16600 [Bacteroidales bacterium]|nr:hypothetical protein [Bacteroidales bacterium]